jgi:hypothetical protein
LKRCILRSRSANFGWWINRKDRLSRSLFEGGFLGLDNIGVFDSSARLPTADPDAMLDHRPPCPCCGGRMVIVEVFARGASTLSGEVTV